MAEELKRRAATTIRDLAPGWSRASPGRSAPSMRLRLRRAARRTDCSFRVSTDGRRHGADRHRRLDLPALARRLLSRQARANEGARICLPPAWRDRDQCDLLRTAK